MRKLLLGILFVTGVLLAGIWSKIHFSTSPSASTEQFANWVHTSPSRGISSSPTMVSTPKTAKFSAGSSGASLSPPAAVQVTPIYLNPPANEPQEDVENVQAMLRNYRTVLGENPVGTNAEIMRALTGGNAKQINVGPPEGQQLNDKSELIDHWGTPYFFHQLAKDHMEIRSAGPDRILWTEDDVLAR